MIRSACVLICVLPFLLVGFTTAQTLEAGFRNPPDWAHTFCHSLVTRHSPKRGSRAVQEQIWGLSARRPGLWRCMGSEFVLEALHDVL